MKKMVINSLYNTLIDKEDAIPLSTMLEIERIRKSGNKFVVLTNRSAEELAFYNRDFPFIDYIIAFNGNYVLDVENNKCLLDSKLREADIELINNDYIKSSLFVYNKKTYLEITSAKSNNCKAAELLMRLEEIKKTDVTAILGNDSEIDLLRHIKNSYVVSNAKEIKKISTNKTKSNNAKGSENIIKKIQ